MLKHVLETRFNPKTYNVGHELETMEVQNTDRPMYRWREWSDEQRGEALNYRRAKKHPWHGVPHRPADHGFYMITGACYEHAAMLNLKPGRMSEFEAELLGELSDFCQSIFAWVVLPNHYHVLVESRDILSQLVVLGRMNGRTSHRWNGEDGTRGRKVWSGAAETAMKSEGHFRASLNYVLHNPVRHGYVRRWQDWPYSNAAEYLERLGRDAAVELWKRYPLFDYGADWDPPEL